MLHESWEQSGFTGNRNDCYIKGAEDFQQAAIKKLSSFINTSPELAHANPGHQDGLIMCIEIIKQLKSE